MEKNSHIYIHLEIIIVHLVLGIDIVIIPTSVTQEAWELISFSPLERQAQSLLSSRNANRFVRFCSFIMCSRTPRNLVGLYCYNQTSVAVASENILFCILQSTSCLLSCGFPVQPCSHSISHPTMLSLCWLHCCPVLKRLQKASFWTKAIFIVTGLVTSVL